MDLLGLLVAVATALAPATLLLVPVIGVALFVSSLLVGRGKGGLRFLLASLVGSAVAFIALAPWSFGAFRHFSTFFESTSGPVSAIPLSSLLRLDTGSYGGGVLSWALLAAAAVPLFIGRSWRLAWAARLWMVAFACLALAWAASRSWFPAPTLEVILAPAGAALAFSVAVGVASVEVDLSGYRFGWRQFAPAFGALAVVAAALPFVSWAGGGQWGLPASAAESAYAFPTGSQGGDYRVLWIGTPGALPLAPQGFFGGLAFSTSLDGLPLASQLWAPNEPGRATVVTGDIQWAENNETTALGHLLAPLAVRYVVVPVAAGTYSAATNEVVAALDHQVDMVPVGTDPSYRVYVNSSWVPLFSELAANTDLGNRTSAWATAARLQEVDVVPVQAVTVGLSDGGSFALHSHSRSLQLYGAVPTGSWRLRSGGSVLPGSRGPWVGQLVVAPCGGCRRLEPGAAHRSARCRLIDGADLGHRSHRGLGQGARPLRGSADPGRPRRGLTRRRGIGDRLGVGLGGAARWLTPAACPTPGVCPYWLRSWPSLSLAWRWANRVRASPRLPRPGRPKHGSSARSRRQPYRRPGFAAGPRPRRAASPRDNLFLTTRVARPLPGPCCWSPRVATTPGCTFLCRPAGPPLSPSGSRA